MKRVQYARGLVLLSRANAAKELLEKYDVLEKEENQRILRLISGWYETIARSTTANVSFYYEVPNGLTDENVGQLSSKLDDLFENLRQAHVNLRFVPAPPPSESVRYMIDRMSSTLKDEWRVSGLAFKGLAEVNFEEYMLTAPAFAEHVKAPGETFSPTVLSLANFYLDDPLMWPLLLHEYGHALFSKLDRDPEFDKVLIGGMKLWDSQLGRQHNGKHLQQEIFADLFGLFSYGTPFLLAFASHIVLPRTKSAMVAYARGNYVADHPPALLRMEYLRAALNQTSFKDDPLAKDVLELVQPHLDACATQRAIIPATLVKFCEENAKLFSGFLAKATWRVPMVNGVDKLTRRLRARQPIATRVIDEADLANLLAAEDERIEDPVEPFVIIYAGWHYLFYDLLRESLATHEQAEGFLKLPSNSTLAQRISRFSEEHARVRENLRFSLETSLVVGRMDP